MKRLATLLLLPTLTIFSACSGDAIEGKVKDVVESGSSMMDNMGDMDLGDLTGMSTDKLKEMFSGATDSITEQLSSVKDLADAEGLMEKVGPLLDKLGSLKGALGGNMPSMDSLTSAITGLKDKFAGDDSIMGILQPILDKLQSLMG